MTRPDDLDRLAAYALGTLDGDDRRAVEQLVAADADARVELDGYCAAVALLDTEDAPRPAVWDRVSAAIADDPVGAPVALLAVPVRRRTRRGRVLVAAAAAAMLAVAAWGAGQLRTASPTTATVALQQEARQAGATPGARQLTVASPDATSIVRVILLPDGRGFVVGGVLAKTAVPTTYALYATTAGRPVLVAVLGTTLHVVAFHMPRDAGGLAVGVTDAAVQALVTPAPAACSSCASRAAPSPSDGPPSNTSGVPARGPSSPPPPATGPTGQRSEDAAPPSGHAAPPLLPPLALPVLPVLQHLLP